MEVILIGFCHDGPNPRSVDIEEVLDGPNPRSIAIEACRHRYVDGHSCEKCRKGTYPVY